MSDLFCPARFLVARHGEASYGKTPRGVLSNDPGELTDLGRQQAAQLGESLRRENVAAVYCSTVRRAQQTADIVAEKLGHQAVSIGGIQEYEVGDFTGVAYSDHRVEAIFNAWMDGDLGVGFPGGENGDHIVERVREGLSDLADIHRGECVVVISHGGVMSVALPRLGRNVRNDLARKAYLPNAEPAEIQVDADGFNVISWPGVPDV